MPAGCVAAAVCAAEGRNAGGRPTPKIWATTGSEIWRILQ